MFITYGIIGGILALIIGAIFDIPGIIKFCIVFVVIINGLFEYARTYKELNKKLKRDDLSSSVVFMASLYLALCIWWQWYFIYIPFVQKGNLVDAFNMFTGINPATPIVLAILYYGLVTILNLPSTIKEGIEKRKERKDEKL